MNRLSVNIHDETRNDLRDIAARRGCSVTEVVRRSVAVYEALMAAQEGGFVIELVEGADSWSPSRTRVFIQ